MLCSSSVITPALTEASKSVEVVKTRVGYNERLRPSGDWSTLTIRTLRFNALLYSDYRSLLRCSWVLTRNRSNSGDFNRISRLFWYSLMNSSVEL